MRRRVVVVRRGVPVAGLVLALLAAGGGWWARSRSHGRDPLGPVRGLAAPEGDQEPGTPEEILARFRAIGPAFMHDADLWPATNGPEKDRAVEAVHNDNGGQARADVERNVAALRRAIDRKEPEWWERREIARAIREWRAVLARHGLTR